MMPSIAPGRDALASAYRAAGRLVAVLKSTRFGLAEPAVAVLTDQGFHDADCRFERLGEWPTGTLDVAAARELIVISAAGKAAEIEFLCKGLGTGPLDLALPDSHRHDDAEERERLLADFGLQAEKDTLSLAAYTLVTKNWALVRQLAAVIRDAHGRPVTQADLHAVPGVSQCIAQQMHAGPVALGRRVARRAGA